MSRASEVFMGVCAWITLCGFVGFAAYMVDYWVRTS